jgi:hypothetical protein
VSTDSSAKGSSRAARAARAAASTLSGGFEEEEEEEDDKALVPDLTEEVEGAGKVVGTGGVGAEFEATED